MTVSRSKKRESDKSRRKLLRVYLNKDATETPVISQFPFSVEQMRGTINITCCNGHEVLSGMQAIYIGVSGASISKEVQLGITN